MHDHMKSRTRAKFNLKACSWRANRLLVSLIAMKKGKKEAGVALAQVLVSFAWNVERALGVTP